MASQRSSGPREGLARDRRCGWIWSRGSTPSCSPVTGMLVVRRPGHGLLVVLRLAQDTLHDGLFFLKRQAVFAAGRRAACSLPGPRSPTGSGTSWPGRLLLLSYASLLAVLIPGLGRERRRGAALARPAGPHLRALGVRQAGPGRLPRPLAWRPRASSIRDFKQGLLPHLLVAGAFVAVHHAPARPGHLHHHRPGDARHALRGRGALHHLAATHRLRAAPAGGGHVLRRLPPAPRAGLPLALGRPPGQRLPDHPLLPGLRLGRGAGAGGRGGAPEAVVPAPVAHRLHLLGAGRGAGAGRGGLRGGPLPDRSSCAASCSGPGLEPRPLRQLPGPGADPAWSASRP